MIISHKHKFIFIKTQKTAGTSIEIALAKICGPDDIITTIGYKDEAKRREIAGRGAQNHLLPFSKFGKINWLKYLFRGKRPNLFHEHISAEDVKALIDKDIWDSYYKFSFDRNPWDKFVSFYHWSTRKKDKDLSIDEFIAQGKAIEYKGFDLYTVGGTQPIDQVFKYENLSEALEIISEKLGLDEKLKMPKYVAKGGIRKDKSHYSKVLSDYAKRKIELLAAREIAFMDYKYEDKS